jgi:tripeptidyl-peptidase-1
VETFAPSTEAIDAVKAWVVENGIDPSKISLSKGLNWLKFDATVEEAESLLRTKYNVYTNTETGKDHLACEEYSVPAHIREHVDFITPTLHFDAIVKPVKKRQDIQKREALATKPFKIVKPGSAAVPQPAVTFSLANCYQYITPDCLRALYALPNGTLAAYVTFNISIPASTNKDKVIIWYCGIHTTVV